MRLLLTLFGIYGTFGTTQQPEQQSQHLGDWRCFESTDGNDSWTTERRFDAAFESHVSDSILNHGDVCRDTKTNEFFCPVGCSQVDVIPFCINSIDSDSNRSLGPPCRLSWGEPGHEICQSSIDVVSNEAKIRALLQRHNFSDSHGDVCRDAFSDEFFCPVNCTHSNDVPYCESVDSGHPCRVDAVSAKLFFRLQAKLKTAYAIHDLERAARLRARIIALGDTVPKARASNSPKTNFGPFSNATHANMSHENLLKKPFSLPMLVNSYAAPDPSHIPFFFHVPKAAGSTVEVILDATRHLKTLPAGDTEDLAYIERSQALTRQVVDYLKTPSFMHACAMFVRIGRQARAFTFLREPISRLLSLISYQKFSVWEKWYNPSRLNQTMEDYLASPALERNWLVYSLASALLPPPPPLKGKGTDMLGASRTRGYGGPDGAFEAARWVLFEKVVYGFSDDMEYSFALIFKSFGWPWQGADITHLSVNVNSKPKPKSTTPNPRQDFHVKLLAKANSLDLRLYAEARARYESTKSPAVGPVRA